MQNFFENIGAALIDMDGVLYDSMPGHTLAWQRMMSSLGVNCSRDEFYLYEGMTGVATINLLFQREFGKDCDPEEAKRLYAIKSQYFKEMGPRRLMPDADRMLAALGRAGICRVLVTGSGQKSLLDALSRDYPGVFSADHRVTARDVTHGKPHPEPYLMGASKAGVDPNRCVVIENAPLGVRAGKAAGCFTIAVTTGPIPREAFEKEGADMIFPSMGDFADFIEHQASLFVADAVMNRVSESDVVTRADRLFLITDSNVNPLVDFSSHPDIRKMVIPAGEASKNIEMACRLWRFLSQEGATRSSVVIALGGGVVCDLAGFVASTFKRGIPCINVPTTILAAADAAIGGKTAIDFEGLKNEIGTFSMPAYVVIMPQLFSSLPHAEVLSGFAEVIKMAMIIDKSLYDRLLKLENIVDFSEDSTMAEAIRFAAEAKQKIVDVDPRENGIRRILNFGHTAGHAFESVAARHVKPISHGMAVAHGIAVALRLSSHFVHLDPQVSRDYEENFLKRHYPELPISADSIEEILSVMMHDKKNRTADRISFVLLKNVGEVAKPIELSTGDIAPILEELL
ncbi:MAG: 3-dehydroquinate synthase [Lepagella sp.]